jgi:hypothetical protein
LLAPFQIPFRRRGKQAEQARGIGAVLIEQGIGVDHIFLGFGHFFDPPDVHGFSAQVADPFSVAVLDVVREEKTMLRAGDGFFAYHALGQQARERLLVVDQPEFPRTRV